MKIGLLQVNQTVGDIEGNADRILARTRRARDLGADLAVFSELALPGYPPNDLLERDVFIQTCADHEARIVAELPDGVHVAFGTVHRSGPALENVVVVAKRGEVVARAAKVLLPTYDVFDEARYFRPGDDPENSRVEIAGQRIGLTICEDLWNDKELWPERRYPCDPVERQVEAGVDVIINLSSSPFSTDKIATRRRIIGHAAARHRVWIAYVNQVGGNDGLIFDGHSMVFGPDGTLRAEAKGWVEDVVIVDTNAAPAIEPAEHDAVADIDSALVLGIQDYFRKLDFKRAVIALSGGIDSAVTAYLAVRALGKENVVGLSLPSRYSSSGSIDDAIALATNLGITCHTIEIEPMFKAFLEQLAPVFGDQPPGLAEENIQARIRGSTVMAYSNKHGAVVLTTGNKSESAVGYCTLYGDTNGGLAPLADLYKHQVYAVARYANRDGEIIPVNTIDKPPSAELRPDQKDEDSLPPYDVLDEMLRLLIEERRTGPQIAEATGQPIEVVQDIMRKVYGAEFKRKQFPPTLRVSQKAWIGRVYPLAHRFRL